jgi:hypothetical protein
MQERIPGSGIGVFACYQNGKMVSLFGHRRIREKPPSGGVSVLRESVPVSPQARASTAKLLDHLKWHGVAMVEFKMDDRDGLPKLMEINGRFWGSLQLAIDAGVDFPGILLRIAQGETVEPVFSYKEGVKTRWLWGDVDSLMMLLVKRRASLHLPEYHPGRIRTIFDFLRFFGKDLHYEIESREDPRPSLHELSQRFRPSPGSHRERPVPCPHGPPSTGNPLRNWSLLRGEGSTSSALRTTRTDERRFHSSVV